MHTKQLFPAVCFCKDLIPDALIFLLWLNTLFKQDFFAFLGFHKWSLTFLPHCRVFVLHGFSLRPPPPPPHTTCPQPMAVAAVIPNRLSLVFHYGYEWRNDNDPGNLHLHANSSFDYVQKLRSPRARWKNRVNVLATENKIKANFLLITKRLHIQEMFDCIDFSSFKVCVDW